MSDYAKTPGGEEKNVSTAALNTFLSLEISESFWFFFSQFLELSFNMLRTWNQPNRRTWSFLPLNLLIPSFTFFQIKKIDLKVDQLVKWCRTGRLNRVRMTNRKARRCDFAGRGRRGGGWQHNDSVRHGCLGGRVVTCVRGGSGVLVLVRRRSTMAVRGKGWQR